MPVLVGLLGLLSYNINKLMNLRVSSFGSGPRKEKASDKGWTLCG